MDAYWINAEGLRLAIIQRPRGQEWLSHDIASLRQAGVDVIVSALTASETEGFGLLEEAKCCENIGVQFLSFPIEGCSVPASLDEFNRLLISVAEYLRKGKAVAVHCREGIGRSAMIAASVLARNGLSVNSAFRLIEEARGRPVPDTSEQRQWVERFSSCLSA